LRNKENELFALKHGGRIKDGYEIAELATETEVSQAGVDDAIAVGGAAAKTSNMVADVSLSQAEVKLEKLKKLYVTSPQIEFKTSQPCLEEGRNWLQRRKVSSRQVHISQVCWLYSAPSHLTKPSHLQRSTMPNF